MFCAVFQVQIIAVSGSNTSGDIAIDDLGFDNSFCGCLSTFYNYIDLQMVHSVFDCLSVCLSGWKIAVKTVSSLEKCTMFIQTENDMHPIDMYIMNRKYRSVSYHKVCNWHVYNEEENTDQSVITKYATDMYIMNRKIQISQLSQSMQLTCI